MRYRRRQDGAESVEFALVAPLLFVILFAIIEFAVALFDQAILTNISREGARFGITYQLDADGDRITGNALKTLIEARVDTLLAGARLMSLGGSSAATRTVTAGTNANGGDDVSVQVGYPYHFMVLRPLAALLGGAIPATLELRSTTIMRME